MNLSIHEVVIFVAISAKRCNQTNQSILSFHYNKKCTSLINEIRKMKWCLITKKNMNQSIFGALILKTPGVSGDINVLLLNWS